MEDEWVSAADAFKRVGQVNPYQAAGVICGRAFDGLIKARARLLIVGNKRQENAEVPPEFWWARGRQALTQNWAVGDFETWIDRHVHWRAYGVQFLARDIDAASPPVSGIVDLKKMMREPGAVEPVPMGAAQQSAETPVAGRGGRRMSEKWTDWVAELANYIHEEGVPAGSGADGQDALIGAIEERLLARGLDGPSRSTVQTAVRAALLRLRAADN
jgi:hypothetical protein